MPKRSWAKVIAVVGLACVLGAGWALGSSRARDVRELQPPVEIPLYEGAQVEWEVHLTAQEMGQQFAQWAQELSVLKISGYMIADERALDVLTFYDQALSEWRRIFWAQPSEGGGARVFAQGRAYLLVVVSKRYAATELIVATAQADESAPDVPLFEGAELHWELVLTKNDLLGHLARWFGNLMENPPLAMRMRIWEQPESPQDSLTQLMGWLGILGIELVSRLFTDFSELRIVGYRLDGDKALDVVSFYEQHFGEWTRNFWAKPEESGGVRVFSQGSAEGLKELAVIISQRYQEITRVIVLHARR
ncbi:MAG: hypothetical protein N3E42_06515 [Candidatus Bipolaricaulota bacterium]|nr:hypothetical protein [Candidatus Bipolaricaulota bacterium]